MYLTKQVSPVSALYPLVPGKVEDDRMFQYLTISSRPSLVQGIPIDADIHSKESYNANIDRLLMPCIETSIALHTSCRLISSNTMQAMWEVT